MKTITIKSGKSEIKVSVIDGEIRYQVPEGMTGKRLRQIQLRNADKIEALKEPEPNAEVYVIEIYGDDLGKYEEPLTTPFKMNKVLALEYIGRMTTDTDFQVFRINKGGSWTPVTLLN
jgi:hypothetical protein